MNSSEEDVGDVPLELVTVMSTVPESAGDTAVIWVRRIDRVARPRSGSEVDRARRGEVVPVTSPSSRPRWSRRSGSQK